MIRDQEHALYQAKDGTVFKQILDHWFYLSPLFGEWLPAFDREPVKDDLKPYPRNLPRL